MANPLVVTPSECQGKTWHAPIDVGFACSRGVIPVHAGELAKAAVTMPIAVIRAARGWQLVAVCGLNPERNVFIQNGQWLGHYQPQWLSTFPFSVIRLGERGVLTFDRDSGLLADDGSGEPFFTEEGAMHSTVVAVLDRLKTSFGPQQATDKALTALQQAGLLMPWPERLQTSVGMQVPGLHMINEQAMMTLADEHFLALRKAQALPIAYALNLSIQQTHLLARLARLNPDEMTPPENLDELFNEEDDIRFDFDS